MSENIVSFEKKFLPEIRDIFFESSSKKTFRDEAEKNDFFYKYLGYYLEHYPELCFVAIDEKVLGYVVTAPDSHSNALYSIQPHLRSFENYFNKFPAHLHINCHRDSRGRGVGSKLIAQTENSLKSLEVSGLHIMTAPDAANQNFYKKLGFNFQVIEDFQGSSILLMGKEL